MKTCKTIEEAIAEVTLNPVDENGWTNSVNVDYAAIAWQSVGFRNIRAKILALRAEMEAIATAKGFRRSGPADWVKDGIVMQIVTSDRIDARFSIQANQGKSALAIGERGYLPTQDRPQL